MIGRPKVRPELIVRALELVVAGNTFSQAALTVGIHRNSLLNWRKRLLADGYNG